MAENVTLAPVSSFTNDTSAVALTNANYTLITTAFADCLSRAGVSPNAMGSNLDMNSNQILNLPAPATVNSPARLVDVASNPTITVPPVGTSGGTVPLLNSATLNWTTQTFNVNSPVQFDPQLTLTNSTNIAGDSGPYFIVQRDRGGNPVQNGDVVGALLFNGFANGAYQHMSDISCLATGAPSGNIIPCEFIIKTTSAGGPQLNNFFTFDQNGNFEAPAGVFATNVGIGTISPVTQLQIFGSGPSFAITDSSQGVNSKTYDFVTTGGSLQGRLVNDAYNASTPWISVTRSGIAISAVTFPNSPVTFAQGALFATTNLIGTNWQIQGSTGNFFPNAVLAAGTVTGLNTAATTAGGFATPAITFGSSNIGIYFGSGVPTISGVQGSLYIRQDGGASTAIYLNTSSGSGTTWVAVT